MREENMFKFILVSFISLIISLSLISASIPQTLSIQGRLTNSSGNVLTGTYNMTFRIYNVSSGGTALYEFANQTISVDSGIYHIILNNVNLTFDEQYYLGISIESDSEMIPRINLTSSPYTFRANVTDYLDSSRNYEMQNLTLGEKISFSLGGIIDNLIDGFIRITGNLRVEGTGNFSGTIYINNATDVSQWMYNETIATFNLYNATWDNNWVNQFAYNHTTATFNLYNDTWDEDSWVLANFVNKTDWTTHDNYPSNCSSGQYVFGIGDTLFCSTPSGTADIYVNESGDTMTGLLTINVPSGLALNVSNNLFVNGTSVGIGTTSPRAKLDVKGSLQVGDNAVENASYDSVLWHLGDTTSGFRTIIDSGNTYLGIEREYYGWQVASLAIQRSTGNVGIGTSSPNALLEVNGSFGEIVRFQAATNRQFWIDTTNPDNLKKGENFIFHADPTNVHANTIIGFNIDGSEKMRIQNDGKAGIGTESPFQKLDVSGGGIVARTSNWSQAPRGTVDNREVFRATGSTSDYIISIQDGTGRVQHYWNARPGDGSGTQTYLVDGEQASKILISSDPTFSVQSAPSGTAGNSITWTTYFTVLNAGLVGVNRTPTTYAFEVGGVGWCSAGASCWATGSDIASKKNIKPLEYGLNEILSMEPKRFEYKEDGEGIGLIAQEVEKIVPEIVFGEEGNKSIGYGGLTPVLINAIKEQQLIIQQQNNTINILKSQMQELCLKDKTYSWCK